MSSGVLFGRAARSFISRSVVPWRDVFPLLALICSPLLFVHAVHARASEHVTLRYEGSSDCANDASILRAIDRQLGGDFHTSSQLDANIRLIRHAESDYELSIDYSTSTHMTDHRVIHAESCKAATDAVALLLALALVPEQNAPKSADDERGAITEATVSRNEVGALGALDTAIMPLTAAGGGIHVGLNLGAWRVNLSAVQWIRQHVFNGTIRSDIDYLSFALGVCYLVALSAFEAGPCARVEIGRIGGFANGAAGARPDDARLEALGLGAQARLRLFSPVWLMLEPSLAWVERRPRLVLDDFLPVHQPGLWTFRILFGPLLVW